MMQYLGALRGTGTLECGDKPVGAVTYDLDGYLLRPGEVVASGELRTEATTLNDLFGRRDINLRTKEGRVLSIRFSGRRGDRASDAAHVDVGGDLPPAKYWKRSGS
jgi:hypothetical protein